MSHQGADPAGRVTFRRIIRLANSPSLGHPKAISAEPAPDSLVRAGKQDYLSIPLSSIRTSPVFRSVLIVVMMLGWLVFSQRCALGQLSGAARAGAVQHQCCGKEGQPPFKESSDSRGAACCHGLSALVPGEVKSPAIPIADRLWLPLQCQEPVLPRPADNGLELFHTSPPRESRGFVELVLHRSLHSHAPPPLA